MTEVVVNNKPKMEKLMFSWLLKKITKYVKSSNVIHRLEQLVDYRIKSNQLLNAALTSNDPITKLLNDGETELIASLTTYNKRIHDVHLVIESIAQQTVKPNRILLWLDEDEFTLETIPLILHKQIARGLEVRFCPNYRSYKKLIPTMVNFPDANVITIDDDVIYPYDMIEIFLNEHQRFSNCVLANLAHKITVDKNEKLLPYQEWEHGTKDDDAGYKIVPIGIGGIFYPAKILHEECLNYEAFTSLAPFADDIWFKAMSLLNGVKSKKISDNRKFWNRFLVISDSQDIALMKSNLFAGDNDSQIIRVLDKYNLIHIGKYLSEY